MDFNWPQEIYRYQYYFLNIKKFYQQKKAKVYTEITLSFLLSIILVVFALRPTVLTITELIKKIDDQKTVNKRLEEKINNLTRAQQEYVLIQEDLYLLDQLLPEEPQLSIFVSQLEALAKKENVYVYGIQYSPLDFKGKRSGDVGEITFDIMVGGSYEDLKKFLHSLNNFRRIINFNGFNLSKGKKEGELILSLKGKVFYLERENERNKI